MALASTLAQHTSDLPITGRHLAWLRDPTPYTAEALEFAQWALSDQRPHRDYRLIRASDFNRCMRRRIFTWMRIPEDTPISASLRNTFQTGDFLHLKWQMAGLTEGWLVDPEADLPNYDNRSGARIDGVLWDGSLFEFKTCRDDVYKKVVREKRPLYEHVGQTTYAMLNAGVDEASVVYENKADSSQWIELRITLSDHFVDQVNAEVAEFDTYRQARQLPPILEGDAAKQCRSCPFRRSCPDAEVTVGQWKKAEAKIERRAA